MKLKKMKLKISSLFVLLIMLVTTVKADNLPSGFVYLSKVDPTIVQELRYAGDHNFIGRPIKGYEQAKGCILTQEAAQALQQVQTELRKSFLSLKVYDCYRPQRAVND